MKTKPIRTHQPIERVGEVDRFAKQIEAAILEGEQTNPKVAVRLVLNRQGKLGFLFNAYLKSTVAGERPAYFATHIGFHTFLENPEQALLRGVGFVQRQLTDAQARQAKEEAANDL
jgi:hypothetical protein